MSAKPTADTCGGCAFFCLRNEPGYEPTMGWCRCPDIEWVAPNAAGIVYSDSDDPKVCNGFTQRKDLR